MASGYKDCANCGVRNSARNKKCDCGYIFIRETRTIKYDKPSRGKKLCKCGSYIGVRAEYCPVCKNRFEKKIEEIKRVALPPKYKGGKVIFCPSGACPVKLLGFTKEIVTEWCDNIYSSYKDTYTAEAIVYWLGGFYKRGFTRRKSRMR